MKLDFNIPLKDLDQNEVIENGKPLMIGKVLGNLFCQDAHKDSPFTAMDALEIAMKLNRGEAIDLEKKESEYLKGWIEKHGTINIILKAPLLKVFEVSALKKK